MSNNDEDTDSLKTLIMRNVRSNLTPYYVKSKYDTENIQCDLVQFSFARIYLTNNITKYPIE